MEMTIVFGGGAVRVDQYGAAMPTFGFPLRPRRGSAVVARLVGGHLRTATDPTPALTLDVTPAGTS